MGVATGRSKNFHKTDSLSFSASESRARWHAPPPPVSAPGDRVSAAVAASECGCKKICVLPCRRTAVGCKGELLQGITSAEESCSKGECKGDLLQRRAAREICCKGELQQRRTAKEICCKGELLQGGTAVCRRTAVCRKTAVWRSLGWLRCSRWIDCRSLSWQVQRFVGFQPYFDGHFALLWTSPFWVWNWFLIKGLCKVICEVCPFFFW